MKHTQKFLQQRKFLMVAPVLVVPFLTALFWTLGGGKGIASNAKQETSAGLNFEVPVAHFGEEELDKLSLYEKARRDSVKFQEARDNDPYFKLDELELAGDGSIRDARKTARTSGDPNEILVNNKLAELYKALDRRPGEGIAAKRDRRQEGGDQYSMKGDGLQDVQPSEDMRQLSAMMEMMQSRRNGADPDETRISSMLDKILDIQHPERVVARQKADNIPSGAVAVKSTAPETETSFFGLDEAIEEADSANAIEAVVHSTQELVAGSTVKMRLLKDLYVDDHLIEKDRFVFGTAGINGERLLISVASVRSDNSLYQVKLNAYDLDGLEGIYVPGAITRDAAKQSSDQAMQGMQFMTMDQSIGAQAGAAGIQAAKGLFSKKVKLVRVTVKAGYRILLRDTRR